MPALGCSRLERGVLVSVIAGEEPGSRCNAYTRHEKQPHSAFAPHSRLNGGVKIGG